MEESIKFKNGLPVINVNAAGIDVGDTQFYVATFNTQDGHSSKKYGCFLATLMNWFPTLKNPG